MESIEKKLIIAISSRALFDLDESNEIFEKEGTTAYAKYQIEHEEDILRPGVAFQVTKKLLNLNKFGHYVEIILLSRNSVDTGLRIFNSIGHYGLNITRATFTGGSCPHYYAAAFHAHLFLSANPIDVKAALASGCAAAKIMATQTTISDNNMKQLRIAFDGDAVIFSDEAEKIYQEKGLAAFMQNEQSTARKPLTGGPLQNFLEALHRLQTLLPVDDCPIRTALISARSAPAHERVIRTLRAWNIRIDEALFLGGLDKGEFLGAFKADIYFDDQEGYCLSARNHVATCHIPNGVVNDLKSVYLDPKLKISNLEK